MKEYVMRDDVAQQKIMMNDPIHGFAKGSVEAKVNLGKLS